MEFSIGMVHKSQGHRINGDEYVLSETVELLSIDPGVPPGIGEVAVVREVGYLCKKRDPLGIVSDFFDVPDIEGCVIGCNEPVRKDTAPDQTVF
jgi:hypothetical protein